MALLLKNVTNSILLAFNSLYQEAPGLVNKSKLKVLTANIATLLDDLYGVEKGLEHFRSTITLNFEHFKYYLSQEVFSTIITTTLLLSDIRNYENKIDELCWLICRKNYLINNKEIYDDNNLYKLFRIFCMLGELIQNNNNNDLYDVVLHSSEASIIVKELIKALGLNYETDKKYDNLISTERTFKFNEFIELVEFKEYNKEIIEYKAPLSEAINEMYQTYIQDVIRKGFLLRKGYLLPTLREYWFVLQPCELSYYKKSTPENILCGSIQLDSSCTVKPCPGLKNDKFQRFIISSGERNYEFATHDHRTRLQWIAALQLAITYSAGKEGFQRNSCLRRRTERELEKSLKCDEELLKNCHINEAKAAKEQLEEEKEKRKKAENQARQLQAVAMIDSRRVAELEDIKMTLEKLLKDETQAKRDEEIVRALQARVLAEEWEKREELERLQDEQRNLLEHERRKRAEFEVKQKDKEIELKDAEYKLKQLEIERHNLDMELKQARNKIYQSEETKEVLEARLQAMNPSIKDGERVRRCFSFMPSTKERQKVEIRAATLRRSKV